MFKAPRPDYANMFDRRWDELLPRDVAAYPMIEEVNSFISNSHLNSSVLMVNSRVNEQQPVFPFPSQSMTIKTNNKSTQRASSSGFSAARRLFAQQTLERQQLQRHARSMRVFELRPRDVFNHVVPEVSS